VYTLRRLAVRNRNASDGASTEARQPPRLWPVTKISARAPARRRKVVSPTRSPASVLARVRRRSRRPRSVPAAIAGLPAGTEGSTAVNGTGGSTDAKSSTQSSQNDQTVPRMATAYRVPPGSPAT
jgi:hypothetical protein